MKLLISLDRPLAHAAVLLCALVFAGCNYGSHPDEQSAVYKALGQNNLSSVSVFQDRHAGTITLRGIVADPGQKTSAATLAKQAAPDYTIADLIRVQPTGLAPSAQSATAKADEAIDNAFKADLTSNSRLKDQHIQYSATNDTLYLKGSVRTATERRDAENLARKIPNVQHVVNDIQVVRENS